MTVAVAFVFQNIEEIIALAWIFEAIVLLFLFKSMKDIKVYIAAMILYFIGVGEFIYLSFSVQAADYIALVPAILISISSFYGLKLMSDINDMKVRVYHDIAHAGTIIGIMIFFNSVFWQLFS